MAGTRADKLGGVGRRLTKIYIAGKITGDEGYREKFRRAAETVSGMGCIPLNPAEQPEGMAAQDYMRMCFAMIDIADAVLFLPDWRGSPGAMLEKVLAGRLLAEWKERKVPRTPLGQDAETCKRWMCDGDCPAWMACLGKLGPREQIRELMEAMGYAGGTV